MKNAPGAMTWGKMSVDEVSRYGMELGDLSVGRFVYKAKFHVTKCPRRSVSVGGNVCRATDLGGKMYTGRMDHGTKCTWEEMSWREL